MFEGDLEAHGSLKYRFFPDFFLVPGAPNALREGVRFPKLPTQRKRLEHIGGIKQLKYICCLEINTYIFIYIWTYI